jgi:tetratricopeptide (TPR) repeat protein
MLSIIEGYNNDIFISYRQKDNKGDRWVSEFVEALKTELESTFKEEISVYFDINPHDGLLDTHDVNASLKEKLKCLVFIPIISRTYCDPKSFAWEHEFKAFVQQASQDQFGLKVKLPNGNVASRVLPIRIHDLDTTDIKLCESIIDGVLRGVEFIYKSAGVNRPLRSKEDSPGDNLNKTYYRDQINKVANAIKEIISGLKTEPIEPAKENTKIKKPSDEVYTEENQPKKGGQPVKLSKRKVLSGVAVLMIFIIAGVLAYPKIFHSAKSASGLNLDGRMSIVVNKFDNKTGDAAMDSWGDIIPDLLRGYLATSKELSVQNTQTMFEVYESISQTQNASDRTSKSDEAAKILKADFYLTGNFQEIRNKSLIVSSLVNTKSGEILMTRSVDGNLDAEYKEMVDSLSRQIKNFLEIKVLEQNADKEYQEAFTNSVEAYRKYIEGMKFIMNGDNQVAAKTLEEAYRIDTTFTFAAFFCSYAYCFFDNTMAAFWERKAYPGKERLPEDYRMWLEFWHGWFTTKNKNDILNYCSIIEKSNTKSRFILFDIGVAYNYLGKLDKSVSMFEKIEEVSAEWGEDWKYRDFYTYFADACHIAGQYDREAKVLQKGLDLFPDDIDLIWRQARLALSKGKVDRSNELIKRFEYLCKRSNISESIIQKYLGYLYEQVDSLDKAEQYYRQALDLQPDNVYSLNNLAYFLINKDRNLNEGLTLVDKALVSNPDNYDFWDTKGWGLYKQGKYKESIELLEQSWNSSPSYAWHDTYLHLEEAKKAVAGQGKN